MYNWLNRPSLLQKTIAAGYYEHPPDGRFRVTAWRSQGTFFHNWLLLGLYLDNLHKTQFQNNPKETPLT